MSAVFISYANLISNHFAKCKVTLGLGFVFHLGILLFPTSTPHVSWEAAAF